MGLFLFFWKGGRQIIQHPVCFPTALVGIRCGTSLQLAILTLPGIRPSVADDSATAVPSDCLRHGDARIGEPRVALRAQCRFTLTCPRLGQGWDSDAIAKDFRMCHFAAVEDRLDVPR